MSENCGGVWPEQEAVEAWWKKHSLELKNAVTEERVRLKRRLESVNRPITDKERSILATMRDLASMALRGDKMAAVSPQTLTFWASAFEAVFTEAKPPPAAEGAIMTAEEALRGLREWCVKYHMAVPKPNRPFSKQAPAWNAAMETVEAEIDRRLAALKEGEGGCPHCADAYEKGRRNAIIKYPTPGDALAMAVEVLEEAERLYYRLADDKPCPVAWKDEARKARAAIKALAKFREAPHGH